MVDCNTVTCKLSEICGLYVFLILLGALVVYIVIGLLVSRFAKEFLHDHLKYSWTNESDVLSVSFWPVMLAVIVLYYPVLWVVRIVSLPFVAATKTDLKECKAELLEKIETTCGKVKKEKKTCESKAVTFKVGDLIKGKKGNPDGYKYLTEKSVSRVLSINEIGSMQLRLVDHKDKEKYKEKVGEVFTAPARNFVLYKKSR